MAKLPAWLSAEEARAKAAQCRDEAKRTGNPEHKVMLEHMAQTWERMAKSFEGVDGDGRATALSKLN